MRDRMVIVMAEDDEDDQLLARAAIKDADLDAWLQTVADGAELLDYLKRRGAHSREGAAPRPGLVLLDLNMPRMGGHEALQAIKQDPELRAIPVVVFTTSTAEEDIARTYDAGGNTFITKPRNYPALVDTMRSFRRYWQDTASLPPAIA